MFNNEKWASEVAELHRIISSSGLNSTIKWGAPVYTYKGKNIVSAGGFKNHFTIWFYNGVHLKDKAKVLINAQEGKTKSLRQWRFTSKEEIDAPLILEYIQEAIINEDAGLTIKPNKSAPLPIPEILSGAFNENSELEVAFKQLTPYKQKDYIEYIATAKRDETKQTRLEKIIPMILNGLGLNDKYL